MGKHDQTIQNARNLFFAIQTGGPITKLEIQADTGLTGGQFTTAFAFLREAMEKRGVPINYNPSDWTYSIPTAVDWEESRDYEAYRLRIAVTQQERLAKHMLASSMHHPSMEQDYLAAANDLRKTCVRIEKLIAQLESMGA